MILWIVRKVKSWAWRCDFHLRLAKEKVEKILTTTCLINKLTEVIDFCIFHLYLTS